MIKVFIKEENQKILLIEVKGHANSAPKGEDLVCAAVSAIVTAGANNINDLSKIKVDLKEGHAKFEASKDISSRDEIVLETIVGGLKTIAESNPKFIKIEIL